MVRRRLVMIGIDGFSPQYMDLFVEQGGLPAIQSVIQRGVRTSLFSTLPACTPVAWATIATGAPPSVTGIEGFLLHREGSPLDERISGCYSNRCQAEPIWSTATQFGKRAYVVKFPLSYPSSEASFRLDGAAGWGGIRCLHEAASSSVGATPDADAGSTRIEPDGETWTNEESLGLKVVWRGVWSLPSLWGAGNLEFYLVAMESDNCLAVGISALRDASQMLTVVKVGDWSSPLTISAPCRRRQADCSFRIKLLECALDPARIRILNTTIHEKSGHSSPGEIWDRHAEKVGPIEEQSEPSLVFHAGLDLKSQIEIMRLNADWITHCSSSLLRNEEWDLFMVQVHFVDWAHHLLQGKLDPRHPDCCLEQSAEYRAMLLQCYRMADGLVGEVIESVGDQADVVVLGDHGQDLRHSSLCCNEWLCQAGLLTWKDSGASVDWTRTQAYAAGNYIYLNLKGREPHGIVEPYEAEALIEAILRGLRDLVDPGAGENVIFAADRKSRFHEMGGDGEGVGDIVFCCASGYQSTNGRGPILERTVALREFTSGHDHFWPCDERIQTALFAAGPSFRRQYAAKQVARLIDVAPTLCAALGIPAPANSQGQVLHDLLDEALEIDSFESVSADRGISL
jgi:predicted AlkP superfamily phosphohydrolase/phosphomutase